MESRAQANTTTDHAEIQRWAEERGGLPSCVRGTGGEGDTGVLRLDFPGFGEDDEKSLQHISWGEWFKKFDERKLALLYQEETAGGAQSNFNKIVSRETAEEAKSTPSGSSHRTKSTSRTGKSSSGKKASGEKTAGKKASHK